MFSFAITKKLPRTLGRAAVISMPHGQIETPAFVTVATKATVKSLTPEMVLDAGAEVVIANTYHIYFEPGHEIVREAGGLNEFMHWPGPTMTDSGGFQVFSLGADFNKKIGKIGGAQKSYSNVLENIRIKDSEREPELVMPLAEINEEGVMFKSVTDGSSHRFTPEFSIEIQHAIGADIIFAFDECTSPVASVDYQKEALGRTERWAKRSLLRHESLKKTLAKQSLPQALFGIVQGGRFGELRKAGARAIGAMNFDGFGIGGSFEKSDVSTVVRVVNEILPEEKPRHLLGIGEPEDLFEAVQNGCDLFDCVAPTRLARNGALYTKQGRINIFNARYKADFSKIDADCLCYSCVNYTKAYLAHLFRAGELFGYTLASIHNLAFIIGLVKGMRRAILDNTFIKEKETFLKAYKK